MTESQIAEIEARVKDDGMSAAIFIAHAEADIPALIAALREAQSERDELRQLMQWADADWPNIEISAGTAVVYSLDSGQGSDTPFAAKTLEDALRLAKQHRGAHGYREQKIRRTIYDDRVISEQHRELIQLRAEIARLKAGGAE